VTAETLGVVVPVRNVKERKTRIEKTRMVRLGAVKGKLATNGIAPVSEE
jgi:hypothetical protein